jgi:hypothetical protein
LPDTFDEARLGTLYAAISAAEGLGAAELVQCLDEAFAMARSSSDVQAYREGKKPWKKLVEEVVPVARFLKWAGLQGSIRFPLDDQPPDAWFHEAGHTEATGIEVTRALARSRVELARDVRDAPVGRGFQNLPDHASQKDFDQARARGRITNSRGSIQAAIENSAIDRLRAKVDSKYEGQLLLLLAPLGSAPQHDWAPTCNRLTPEAEKTFFSKVFLMDDGLMTGGPLLILDRLANVVAG